MLDSITIRSASITKENGKYSIKAAWKEVHEGTPYQGKYELVLLSGEKEEERWKDINGSSCECDVSVEIKQQTPYYIKVAASEESSVVESECMPVLFYGFDKVRGNFDGKMLHLAWEPNENILLANAYVVFARAVSPDGRVVIGEYGDNYLDIPIEMDMMKRNCPGTVKLIPYIEERSRGPEIELHFLPWQIRLDEVTGVEKGEGGITVKIKQSHDYTDTGVSIQNPELCLYYEGQEWKTAQTKGAAAGEELAFVFDGTDADVKILKKATAVLYTGSSETLDGAVVTLSGRGREERECLALGTVENVQITPGVYGTEVTFSYAGVGKPSHYQVELSSGELLLTSEEKIVVTGRAEKNVTVRPCFGGKAGVPSGKNSMCPAGYYLYSSAGKWRISPGRNGLTPRVLSCDIDGEIFEQKIAQKITHAGIELAPQESGYRLTVENPKERTAGDYDTFLSALFDITEPAEKTEGETTVSLLPEFLGEIQEMLGQLTDCAYGELLLCASGFCGEGRYADVRCGMDLFLEAEGYKPPAGTEASVDAGEYLPGYYPGASALYQVHSYGSGGQWRMGFDPFLAGVKEYTQQKVGGALNRQNGEGGLIDLALVAAKSALYRLHYPVRMLRSDEAGSDYAPANVCLIGASTYGQLVEATKSMNQEREVKTAGVTLSYFRGRTIMIPKILVYIDGVRVRVSVGTTLQNVLEQEGIDTKGIAQCVAMWRRSRQGGAGNVQGYIRGYIPGYLPVYFPEAPEDFDWLKLPLLAGDRIEIKRERVWEIM